MLDQCSLDVGDSFSSCMRDNGKITLDLLCGQTLHFEELAVSASKVRHARANEDFINVVGANLRQFRA